MSSAANDQSRGQTDDAALPDLTESEHRPTKMAYEPSSRVPWYVIAVWACLMTAYVVYQLKYLLPDLRAWNSVAW